MPHLTVTAHESDLQGNERDLIATLTDAFTEVYGEWAREHVVVLLNGIPAGRWGVGGKTAESTAGPALIAGVTDAIVLGEGVRDAVLVELIGTPRRARGIGRTPADALTAGATPGTRDARCR